MFCSLTNLQGEVGSVTQDGQLVDEGETGTECYACPNYWNMGEADVQWSKQLHSKGSVIEVIMITLSVDT